MIWNIITVCVFIVYMIITPIYISYDTTLSKENQNILLVFDLIFMIDRIADLMVAESNEEASLKNVIMSNMSSKFFSEIVISFGPLFLGINSMHTEVYVAFKLPRYFRLFEMDQTSQEIIDYLGETRTK